MKISISEVISQAKDGTQVQIFGYVWKPKENTTATNKPYISFNLVDASGTIDTKLWNRTEEDSTNLKNGAFIEVKATFSVYQGTPGIKLNSYQISDDEAEKTAALPKPPVPLHELQKELESFIEHKVNDPYYQKLINLIFVPAIWKKFVKSFAGISMHHSFVGGLLYHTVTMLKMAEKIVPIYEIDLPIDKSLLFAGIIMHDLGKIYEIEESLFPEKYTIEGMLLGHISLSCMILSGEAKKAKLNNNPKLKLLLHLILASHGKKEFGSPMTPVLVESYLLSQLDIMDSTLNAISNELRKTVVGEFSPRVPMLNRDRIYKHFSLDQPEDSNKIQNNN